jgi:trehalose-phosphatase
MKTHPSYLFKEPQRLPQALVKRIKTAQHIALFLDYDGTLTPIQKQPDDAVLSEQTSEILRLLSRIPQISLSIVMGRSMVDIKKFAQFKNINISANHGLHIRTKEYEWIHPVASATRFIIQKIYLVLQKKLKSFPDITLENKHFSLAIHYRNANLSLIPRLHLLIIDAVGPFKSNVSITSGKKVVEIKPRTDWDKGKAIECIVKKMNSNTPPLLIFIGDDTTDEDAFRTLRSKGITICVGKSKKTQAKYYVRSVSQAIKFLRIVSEISRDIPHNTQIK